MRVRDENDRVLSRLENELGFDYDENEHVLDRLDINLAVNSDSNDPVLNREDIVSSIFLEIFSTPLYTVKDEDLPCEFFSWSLEHILRGFLDHLWWENVR